MRRLNFNLCGSHNELILVTLKLLNAMSAFAGGRERKSVSEAFTWETKVCLRLLWCSRAHTFIFQSLSKLLFMRRKTKNDTHIDILARPGES